MKNLLGKFVLVTTCISSSFVFGGNIFTEGDKVLAGSKKPILMRVNAATKATVLFNADTVDSAEIKKLAKSAEAKRESIVSDKVAALEKRGGEAPLLAAKDVDDSTPACYGYYYGSYYPWYTYAPFYYTVRTVTITYVYSWHYYSGGYYYYWYI